MERFRTLFLLVVATGFFGYALAQDAGGEQEAEEENAAAETGPAASDAGEDTGEEGDAVGAADAEGEPGEEPGIDPAFDPDVFDPELDDQTYEGDDDIFVPTEEIPADEPIPFPSDI